MLMYADVCIGSYKNILNITLKPKTHSKRKVVYVVQQVFKHIVVTKLYIKKSYCMIVLWY